MAGALWAEAEVDQAATFYFTWPAAPERLKDSALNTGGAEALTRSDPAWFGLSSLQVYNLR